MRLIEKRARQIAYQEAQARRGGAAKARAETILQGLRDDQRSRGARRAQIRRARNNLERALARYRRESLEIALEQACWRAAEKVLRSPLHEPLPAGFRQTFHLLHSDHTEMELFRDFLADVLAGRSLAERRPNRVWLEQARSAGVDVEAWLGGFRWQAEIAGETIVFETESDPLHSLRMGSYFNTCLTLEGGFNAASTLICAVDVNKQVIFGRRADGTVVARKLIGATAAGELAGYHTYDASGGKGVVRRRLNREGAPGIR